MNFNSLIYFCASPNVKIQSKLDCVISLGFCYVPHIFAVALLQGDRGLPGIPGDKGVKLFASGSKEPKVTNSSILYICMCM